MPEYGVWTSRATTVTRRPGMGFIPSSFSTIA